MGVEMGWRWRWGEQGGDGVNEVVKEEIAIDVKLEVETDMTKIVK